jgi:hypothetical protein
MRSTIATATRKTAETHGYAGYRPRLAVVGSPGLSYLRSLICTASIQQGFDVDLFPISCAEYGNRLADRSSDLSRFLPNVVLLAVDADCPGVPLDGGHPYSLARRAKQQLGAVLISRVIVPVLSSLCGSQAGRSNARLPSMLEAIECRLCNFRDRERVELSFIERAQSELRIHWHLPPIWRRGELQPAQMLLKFCPVGRTVAALWGLHYVCVVVDVNNHPWMMERDIASFLLRWYETESSGEEGRDPTRGPDSFLFVDDDPLVTTTASPSTRAYSQGLTRVCRPVSAMALPS